jgi:cytochrome P450
MSDMSIAPGELAYDPSDPRMRSDPYPVYAELREKAPYHRDRFGAPIFTRFADCEAILRSGQVSSDFRNSNEFARMQESGEQIPMIDSLPEGRPFLFLDPPDHTRLRGLVSKAFTPRVIEELRPRIHSLVDDLLGAAAAQGGLEVIEGFAYPLPVVVISEMLGVPADDHEQFKAWSRVLARALDPEYMATQEQIDERLQAFMEFAQYFFGLFAARRAEPRDDLITALVQAEEAGDKLTEAELLSTCILLLVAGHETTVNLIGNGVLALLRHPDQAAQWRADPSLTKNAVDEILRYDPPVQLTGRIAMADLEIGGHAIAKGEQAVLLIGSANRDPDQFEQPDRLDLDRTDPRHLSFGFGIHHCLGAPLARLEGQVALEAFVTRFPGAQLTTDTQEYKENVVLRGLASLPVMF